MHTDERRRIVLALDEIEADLRRLEMRLYRLRQQLADAWGVRDRGFVEPEPKQAT